jgi:hypothetical protein
MAEARAAATRSWGARFSMPARLAHRLAAYQTTLAVTPPSCRATLQNPPEHFPLIHGRIADPDIYKPLAPIRDRHRSYPTALAHQIDDDPVALPQLHLIQSQTRDFRASQSTSEPQSEHCSVSFTLQSVSRNSIQQLLCLIASQPIADLSPELLDSLDSPDAGCEFWAQPTALGSLGQPRRIAVRCRLIVAADKKRLSRKER